MKILVSALPFLAVPAFAFAQQVVKPPVAQFWMSVETTAGMSMPGMAGVGSLMAGMMGGQAQSGRRLLLQLGSQRAPADGPRADHYIPPSMEMGASLPLVTPQRAAAQERPVRELPEGAERPKGRMLVYWGCGENARPGQPVIIDYAKLGQGQTPPNLVSRRVAVAIPPAPGRNKTYGDWPNPQDPKPVPAAASLRGEHQIKGNYAPDIRFSLGEGQDFMERIELSVSPLGAGAAQVGWKAVPYATGYFATVFGAEGDDAVFWSSSEVQEMGSALMDYVPPAEATRLVRGKVVLAPQTTECTVPAEVVKKVGTPFLSFIAYGPEANFAQPPRPQDSRQPWEPLWMTKVRFKSTASMLLGAAAESGERRPTRNEQAGQPASQPSAAPDPVKEGIDILRGIFGR